MTVGGVVESDTPNLGTEPRPGMEGGHEKGEKGKVKPTEDSARDSPAAEPLVRPPPSSSAQPELACG